MTLQACLPKVPAAQRYRCRAAVLVLVSGDDHVLLGQRGLMLRRHAGEVAFPGGRCERGESPWRTAWRESDEELGLGGRVIHKMGYLTPRRTRHGVAVCPCVARIATRFAPRPDGFEMQRGFWLPLAFLADAHNAQADRVFYRGQWRMIMQYHWQGFRIWGITALMLHELAACWQDAVLQEAL